MRLWQRKYGNSKKEVIIATRTKFTLKKIETRELNERDIDRSVGNHILLPEKKGIKASYWQNHRTNARSEWRK